MTQCVRATNFDEHKVARATIPLNEGDNLVAPQLLRRIFSEEKSMTKEEYTLPDRYASEEKEAQADSWIPNDFIHAYSKMNAIRTIQSTIAWGPQGTSDTITLKTLKRSGMYLQHQKIIPLHRAIEGILRLHTKRMSRQNIDNANEYCGNCAGKG